MRKLVLFFLALSLVFAGCSKSSDSSSKSSKSSKSSSKKKKDKKKKKKSSYTELDAVTGGGSVSGTVTYAGDQKDGSVTFTKDKEVCKNADGTDTAVEGALVAADGKLKNAVVYLTGIKEGKKFTSESVTVDNVGCVFVPRVAIGKKGGKLVAKNSDPVLHNTHLYLKKGNKNIFNIALPTTKPIEKPLRKSGLVDVKCDAHEWMQAYLYVSEHPYATVTDASGAFSMSDVPAGEYSGKVWHEKLGEKDFKVKVDAGGSATVAVAF